MKPNQREDIGDLPRVIVRKWWSREEKQRKEDGENMLETYVQGSGESGRKRPTEEPGFDGDISPSEEMAASLTESFLNSRTVPCT